MFNQKDHLNTASVNYDHLRPPLSSLDIKPTNKEILEETNDPQNPYFRHIFFAVDLLQEEEEFIEEIEKVIRFDGPQPPDWWKEGDYLRFMYQFDWDLNLVCEVTNSSKNHLNEFSLTVSSTA